MEKENKTSHFYKEELTKPLLHQFLIFLKHTTVEASAKNFKRPRIDLILFFLHNIFLSFILNTLVVNLNFMFLFVDKFIPYKSLFEFLELQPTL